MLAAVVWQNLHALPWVAGVAAALVAWTLWAYRPLVRGRSPAVRRGLPGLRLGAVLVAATSALRPTLRRPRTAAEAGPVVVLLDRSASMGVVDAGRPTGNLVAVAAAVGRLPAVALDRDAQAVQADADRLSELADDVARGRDEVAFARALTPRGLDAAAGRFDAAVGELQSAAKAAAGRASALPRSPGLERALAYLSSVPAGTTADAWATHVRDRARSAVAEAEQARLADDDRLYRTDPAVRAAVDALRPATRDQLCRLAVDRLARDRAVVALELADGVETLAADRPPDGSSTDLVAGVQAVLDRYRADPPRAIVVLSDGRQVGASPAAGDAAAAVPVYTVGVGARTPVRDVAVVDAVASPTTAFVGDLVTLRATLRAVGEPASTTVSVTFSVGGSAVETRPVTLDGDRPTPVVFTRRATAAGPTRLAVAVAPLAGEATTANNAADRWVKVIGHRLRVAVVSGVPAGWDAQFVGRMLAAAPWAEVTTAVAVDGRPPSLTPRQVLDRDVVLLFDVPVTGLAADQRAAVSRVVTDGGGLIVAAGPGHVRDEYPADPTLARLLPTAGAALLPWRTWPGPRPAFRLVPSDPAGPPLSPVFRYLPLSPLKPGVLPLRAELTSGAAVLTEGRVGTGRVLWLGTDETWRSRSADGGPFDAFWSDLVRRAAEPPYLDDRGSAALDVDAVAVEPGRPVTVQAKLVDAGGPTVAPRAVLRVTGEGREVRTVPLSPSSDDRRYHATVADLPAGDYELTLDAGGDFARPRVPVHVRRSLQAELADVTGDEGLLRHLSESTGGRFLRLDQVDTLPRLIAALPPDPARPVEVRLWDGPYLFVLVLGLLTAEWAGRKRAGLA